LYRYILEHKTIFTAGYKAIIHIHAVTEECEVLKIVNEIDPKTRAPKEKKKGQAVFLKVRRYQSNPVDPGRLKAPPGFNP
jgi:translation elongation factor EF-1alpha